MRYIVTFTLNKPAGSISFASLVSARAIDDCEPGVIVVLPDVNGCFQGPKRTP